MRTRLATRFADGSAPTATALVLTIAAPARPSDHVTDAINSTTNAFRTTAPIAAGSAAISAAR
jgi:hypothetical protein